jgi:hypothetical protein
VRDRLERFALLAGAIGAVLWVISLFVLEGAGNPGDPSGGEEIAQFYRDDRAAILVAATLHVLGASSSSGSWQPCAPCSTRAARLRG